MAELLRYSEDYKHYELKDFTGLVPIRELEKNEVLRGICQIKDESTGITHIGFVVKTFDGGEIWIGSKLAQSAHEKFVAALDKEIIWHTGGDEMKSMSESVRDEHIVRLLQKIKKNLE